MEDNNIQPLDTIKLADQSGNMYQSIVIMGKRATQIGANLKRELNTKLAEFGPPSDSLDEIVENREQIEIAKHYERMPKPTLLSVAEFKSENTPFQLPG
jgi:DNA-directed RNA polymerase subunit K/omega